MGCAGLLSVRDIRLQKLASEEDIRPQTPIETVSDALDRLPFAMCIP